MTRRCAIQLGVRCSRQERMRSSFCRMAPDRIGSAPIHAASLACAAALSIAEEGSAASRFLAASETISLALAGLSRSARRYWVRREVAHAGTGICGLSARCNACGPGGEEPFVAAGSTPCAGGRGRCPGPLIFMASARRSQGWNVTTSTNSSRLSARGRTGPRGSRSTAFLR